MTAITVLNRPVPKRSGPPRTRGQRPAEDRARIRRPGGAAAIRRPGIGRPVATKGNRT